MSLDPQVAAFYGSRLKDAPGRPLSVEQARRDADAVFNDKESWRLPVFSVEDQIVPACIGEPVQQAFPVPIRIYTPFGPVASASAADLDLTAHGTIIKPLPMMLYFHGGGFVMHNIASHDLLCRKLALTCGCLVLSVGYRLAPEHPWPACMEDGWTVLMWAHQHGAGLGGDPRKLILAGDSAGASISAVLSLMVRDRRRHCLSSIKLDQTGFPPSDQPQIGLQLLCYGPAGCIADDASESVRLFGQGGFVLPRTMMDWCMKQYIPPTADPENPYLNPGREPDLTDLPPTFSITAEYDPLRDDGEAFSRRLAEAGNQSKLYRAPGMMHGFLLYWYRFDRAKEVISRISDEIRRTFHNDLDTEA